MKCDSLSASKIKTLKNCEFMYYLRYELGIRTPPSFQTAQGSLVHEILEDFGKAKRDGVIHPEIESKWMHDIYKAYREDSLWELSGKAVSRIKDCDRCNYYKNGNCHILDLSVDEFIGCPIKEFEETTWLVEKVIHDDTPAGPLFHKVIDVENKFKLQVSCNNDKFEVRGIIDLVVELDSETIGILDYKTGNFTQSYNECLKDPQFLIYHLAGRHIYPIYENIVIIPYYLKKNQMSLAFTREDEEKTKSALAYYYKKINSINRPKRIADKPGRSKPDFSSYICRFFCDSNICEEEHKKFMENGGVVNEN